MMYLQLQEVTMEPHTRQDFQAITHDWLKENDSRLFVNQLDQIHDYLT
jgi:hypothetical protein